MGGGSGGMKGGVGIGGPWGGDGWGKVEVEVCKGRQWVGYVDWGQGVVEWWGWGVIDWGQGVVGWWGGVVWWLKGVGGWVGVGWGVV